MNIDVFTCLAPTSVPFAENLKANLEELKSDTNAIRYHTLGNDKFGELRVPGWVHEGNVNVDLPPSASHASALNQIVNHIPQDSDYVVIADCDVMILQKDWDTQMIEVIEKNEVGCLGTPKFCGVLSVYFTMYKADVFRKIQPNFMPGNETTISVPWYTLTDETEAMYYGMKVGDKLVQDTGWRVPAQLFKAGIPYIMFKYCQLNGNPLNLIFNYKFKNGLFITHFSGSHKHEFSSPECQQWVEGAKRYIA